uniref:UPAR/Ly6 domain-containing protein n=1 Tax=Biomphalaria glabrata TaxID=6526 RepID=A0A2C9LSR6_BIOGL
MISRGDCSLPVVLCLAFTLLVVQPCSTLQCYSCSQTTLSVLATRTCEMNVTAEPVIECSGQGSSCYVQSVKIGDQISSLVRGCNYQCEESCVKFNFLISTLTCTSCCSTDLCNTGSGAAQIRHLSTVLFGTAALGLLWARSIIL